MAQKTPHRILVAPLNWGLGHATRCMPIIHELQRQGAEVWLASDGRALELLKKEFPTLPAISLPAYNIRYATNNMVWNMAWQFPKILLAVRKEYQKIQSLAKELQLTGIISDNRYGCRVPHLKNIFLTHQLNIKMPYTALEKGAALVNHFLIQKFEECWVPDFKSKPNLSGTLSHGSSLKRIRFIGALSRLKKWETTQKYDAIAVLSGPEPQRTFLEEKIIKQAKELPYQFLIVQGKTESFQRFQAHKNIEVISFLTAQALNQAMLESGVIISRSGYSTLMDLAQLGKQAILIPTPGQTEQEYLAHRFFEEDIFFTQQQEALNLAEALKKTRNWKGFLFDRGTEKLLKRAVEDFLAS